jgi:hypothetical protein
MGKPYRGTLWSREMSSVGWAKPGRSISAFDGEADFHNPKMIVEHILAAA